MSPRVAPLLVAGWAQRNKNGWERGIGMAGTADQAVVFDFASITKSFFAVFIATLQNEGLLGWHTPLATLLPELKSTWAGQQNIAALLSHRSGLAPHRELFRASWGGGTVRLAKLLKQAAAAKQRPLMEHAVYSDLGYILLGAGVEHLLNEPLDVAMHRFLLAPWNLTAGSARSWRKKDIENFSSIAPTEVQPGRGGLLQGVVHDDNAWALRGTGLCGHAGLFGTADCLLDFGIHLLEAKEGRGDDSMGYLAPLFEKRAGGTLRMGFDGVSGAGSLAGNRAGPATFGHLGFTGTSFWCDPEAERVTVFLSNRVYPTRANPALRSFRPKIHDFLWNC